MDIKRSDFLLFLGGGVLINSSNNQLSLNTTRLRSSLIIFVHKKNRHCFGVIETAHLKVLSEQNMWPLVVLETVRWENIVLNKMLLYRLYFAL